MISLVTLDSFDLEWIQVRISRIRVLLILINISNSVLNILGLGENGHTPHPVNDKKQCQ